MHCLSYLRMVQPHGVILNQISKKKVSAEKEKISEK